MVTAWIIFFMLPILVFCTGDGNIHLLEEDIAEALHACSRVNNKEKRTANETRQRRPDTNNYNNHLVVPRLDANTKEDVNPYSNTRHNTNALNQIHPLNRSDNGYTGYGAGSEGEKFINSVPRPTKRNDNNSKSNYHHNQNQRVKRNELLINKNNNDECLSQCVFANLHMVDIKGIPREEEFWNKVQTSVTSQQLRVILRGKIRTCFQELQSESEDDGCSYSNKLERCMLLRFSDRKIKETTNNSETKN